MKEIEKEYLNQELKKLKAKRIRYYAGLITAATATSFALPIGFTKYFDAFPFDKYISYDVDETTITTFNLESGDYNRFGYADYYCKTDKVINPIPEDELKAYVFSKTEEGEDGFNYTHLREYTIPNTDENRELVNNCTSLDDIKALNVEMVESGYYPVDFYEGYLEEKYPDKYDEILRWYENPDEMIIVSRKLLDDKYEIERPKYLQAYETITLMSLIWFFSMGSAALFGTLIGGPKIGKLNEKIKNYQEMLDNEKKLELKK